MRCMILMITSEVNGEEGEPTHAEHPQQRRHHCEHEAEAVGPRRRLNFPRFHFGGRKTAAAGVCGDCGRRWRDAAAAVSRRRAAATAMAG